MIKIHKIIFILLLLPVMVMGSKITQGHVQSSEELSLDGSFNIEVQYIIDGETYFIEPPEFVLPAYFTSNYNNTGTSMYDGDITLFYEFNYSLDDIPFYPQQIEIIYQSYYFENPGDTIYQEILITAMVYFTPYNTIEIWSLSDFQDLPRRWFYEGDLSEAIRQYIPQEDIPESNIEPINWDTIPPSEDWRDDYREIKMDGLSYCILQKPLTPDSIDYYSQFGDSETIPEGEPLVTYTGTVLGYLYTEIENDFGVDITIPLSNVYVKLRETQVVGDEPFGETYTNDDGYFEITYNENQIGEGGEIELFLKIKSRTSDTYHVYSTNAVGSKYMHRVPADGEWSVGPDNVTTDVGNIEMIKDDRTYFDAFRSIHWANKAFEYFAENTYSFQANLRIDINYDFNSWYNFAGIYGPTIHLADNHGDDENTTYHEFGHHSMYRLQNNNFTLPWGLDWFNHQWNQENTSVLAWVEGWANFVQATLDAHYYLEDNEYSFDGSYYADALEAREDYSATIENGFRSEYYFGCALYDLWDGPSKGLPSTMPIPSGTGDYHHGWNDYLSIYYGDNYNWKNNENIELDFYTLCQPLVLHPSGSDKIYNLQDYYRYLLELYDDDPHTTSSISRTFAENRVVWHAPQYNWGWNYHNFSSDGYSTVETYYEEPNGPLNDYTDTYYVNIYNKDNSNTFFLPATNTTNNPLTDNYYIGIWDTYSGIYKECFVYLNSVYETNPHGKFTTYEKSRIYIRNGILDLGINSGSNTAELNIDGESLLRVDANGTLKIKPGSVVKITPDNTFLAKDNAYIEIRGDGQLIFETGSYACFEEGVDIYLQDPESKIIFETGVNLGISGNIEENVSHSDCLTPNLIDHGGDGEIIYDCLSYYNFTHTGIVEIEENGSWNNVDYSFNNNIVVKAGVEFTINSSNLEFSDQSKVIIEQGAKLIANNTTFSCLSSCTDYWQGIEVWGDADENQSDNGNGYYQGYLELNDAIIQYAKHAVELWKPDHYSTTGGIIKAYGTTFLNNAKSVHILNYQNTLPGYPGVETDNVCYFEDCTFEINDNYIPNFTFWKHVDLASVKGVKFKASDFKLSNNAPGISQWNYGIAAYSAGFSTTAICTSPLEPCTEYDKCTFNGFYIGIYATTISSTNTFFVNRAEFENNAYGIFTSGVDNETIIYSDFYVGDNTPDIDPCIGTGKSASGYGIDLLNSSGFAIEENYFTKATGAPSGYYTGIRINETQATDEVYKNYFDGLSYGNYALGQNWGTDTWHGLAYFCNENTNNYADFYVGKIEGEPSGIQSKQGDNDHSTGNTFSLSGATWHFYNGGDYQIGYYFCDDCTNENPDDDKLYHVTDNANISENTCPSHYGGSGIDLVLSPDQEQNAEQIFANNLSDYNNVKALYDNLKDGGNTEATLNEVENSWPNDTWELRAELLGKSPHLSMDVLKAAADKTEVLPESIIFEIMAANPDELKKEELIEYLEDKENPLPDYMIDILRQVASGTTYKTVLQQQMARYNQAKTRAAYDIIRSKLNSETTDYVALRNWLDNVGGVKADMQIIDTYMQESNFTDALALANMLPELYQYDDNALSEHSYYLEMLNLSIILKNDNRSITQLEEEEINALVNIAEISKGIAGAQAKGILTYAYEQNYCNCLNVSDNAGHKSSTVVNPDNFAKLYGVDIIVEPNPAKEWAAFNFTMSSDESVGIVKISNASGQIVKTIEVYGKQGQKIWDIRNEKQGVYFYIFSSNGISKSGKIVIIK